MYTAYGEQVCKGCCEYSASFDQLTKSDVSSQYLLTDSTIRTMKYQEKDNPRNPHWSMMKLYLRKQAITHALERWGSLAHLQIEIDKRTTQKHEKQTESVSGLFSRMEEGSPLTKKVEKLTKAKQRKVNMAAIVANIKGTK
jgi:DNA repair protein